MRVLVRADASFYLGTGHIMRQLTLAHALKEKGGDTCFVCREHEGNLLKFIEAQGFKCYPLPILSEGPLGADKITDAETVDSLVEKTRSDWVIADHYSIDADWERRQSVKVLAMDDMFDRVHDCALLLNQNFGVTPQHYDGLISKETLCLTGSSFALLRPEFALMRDAVIKQRGKDKGCHILISMGGSDQPNATGWVMKLLTTLRLPALSQITIVMGPTAPHLDLIKTQVKGLSCPTRVLEGTSKMAELMTHASLAIGAAGSSSWERCAVGLPTVQVVLAENQRQIGQSLKETGAAFSVKMGEDAAFLKAVSDLVFDLNIRHKMAKKAASIVDAKGAKRVVHALKTY